MASSDNYKAWEIDAKDFPDQGTLEEKINFLVGYGVLAPSTHNTQPWTFQVDNDTLLISVNERRKLRFSDPEDSMIYISLGSCLMNIIVAASHYGLSAQHSLVGQKKQPDIKVIFSYSSPSPFAELFQGLQKRRSSKISFSGRRVSTDILDKIKALNHGLSMVVASSDKDEIKKIAELHRISTLEFSGNANFTREVSSWMRLNNTKKYDGMPGFTFGLKNGPSIMAKIMTRLTPKSVKIVAKSDFNSMKSASIAGVIETSQKSPEGFVDAGLVYEHAAVLMATHDIYLAPKAAIIQAGHSKELLDAFRGSGVAAIYFVAGYVTELAKHSPRMSPRVIAKVAKK